jgi:hypothetical protein
MATMKLNTMMQVVITAKRSSPIVSFRVETGGARSGTDLDGDPFGLPREFFFAGRHFITAATEALQGCTCRGYENMTRMTIAALPIVDAMDGRSAKI